MVNELRAEDPGNASSRHISSIKWPETRTVTKDAGICEAFVTTFKSCLPRRPDWIPLISTHNWTIFITSKRLYRLGARVPSGSLRSGKCWSRFAGKISGIIWSSLRNVLKRVTCLCSFAGTDLQLDEAWVYTGLYINSSSGVWSTALQEQEL